MAYTLTKEEEKFWLSQPDELELRKDIEVVLVSKEEEERIVEEIRQSILSL